jgi:hypothetical protein
MNLAAAFRMALEERDIPRLQQLWAASNPHLPQLDHAQAEIAMHRARTESESLPIRHRAYSHWWLLERCLPSGLPDRLKPSADRLYPQIAEAVGIATKFRSPIMKPAETIVRGAMCDAVEDIYADERSPDPAKVKARMFEVKDRTVRSLFGRITSLIPST